MAGLPIQYMLVGKTKGLLLRRALGRLRPYPQPLSKLTRDSTVVNTAPYNVALLGAVLASDYYII
jgi:hypothetical protein